MMLTSVSFGVAPFFFRFSIGIKPTAVTGDGTHEQLGACIGYSTAKRVGETTVVGNRGGKNVFGNTLRENEVCSKAGRLRCDQLRAVHSWGIQSRYRPPSSFWAAYKARKLNFRGNACGGSMI